jgi:hypothetical protein
VWKNAYCINKHRSSSLRSQRRTGQNEMEAVPVLGFARIDADSLQNVSVGWFYRGFFSELPANRSVSTKEFCLSRSPV